ncbi:hypothetical protein BO71DRAFT_392699 [Aspergillus ellipticus CBS 707.79]|uniref:Uncharacterized protein n=1 Tax=Aspergillus ellipticus CBS 707.79 TaxID=1448320 RepID=A0A319CR89_9EURO|nr:hypothetical protein BO71DRAFT_392699 [Aspergillus ellipticus CBS 707.79]
MAQFNPGNEFGTVSSPGTPSAVHSLLSRTARAAIDYGGYTYAWFHLTLFGNHCLYSVCHTDIQCFPHHEFLVRLDTYSKPVVTAEQVSYSRQSYINGLLIATRKIAYRTGYSNSPLANFGPVVRMAGYFGGACASCEWKSHRSRYPYCGLPEEARFVPDLPLSLPLYNTIQDLVD